MKNEYLVAMILENQISEKSIIFTLCHSLLLVSFCWNPFYREFLKIHFHASHPLKN